MLSLQIFLYKYYTCAYSIVVIFFLLPLPLKSLQHFSQPFVPMWNFICPSFSFTLPKKIALLSSIVHQLIVSSQLQAGSHDILHYPH